MLFLCNIANVAQKTFEIVQKLRSREHADIIIPTRMYVDCTRATRDFHVRGTVWRFKKVSADFVCDNGIVEVRSCLMVKLRFRLGRVTAKPLAQHCTLKYGSDLHVNERQKIRH